MTKGFSPIQEQKTYHLVGGWAVVWCCGGGGGVPEADATLAQWNAVDRLREAAATGAEVVLTSSALCQRSLNDLRVPVLPVQDLLEFVYQAL